MLLGFSHHCARLQKRLIRSSFRVLGTPDFLSRRNYGRVMVNAERRSKKPSATASTAAATADTVAMT
jgi:hypothetical protein